MSAKAAGTEVELPEEFQIKDGGKEPIYVIPRGVIGMRAPVQAWKDTVGMPSTWSMSNGDDEIRMYAANNELVESALESPVKLGFLLLPPGTKIWDDGMIARPRYEAMSPEQVRKALFG